MCLLLCIIGEFTSALIDAMMRWLIAFYSLQSVWGEDAEEWNPDRWLETPKEKRVSLGMFANL